MKPPIWKIENDAGCWVFQSASVAAIFIGCAFVVWIPNALPHQSWIAVSGIRRRIASFAAARKDVDVAALAQMPRRDAEHDEAARQAAGQDHVHVREDRERLEHDRRDVVRLRRARRLVDLVADRVLHPRVRDDDEVGREPGAEPDEVDRRQMHLRRQDARGRTPTGR